jgi:hypothetical protein
MLGEQFMDIIILVLLWRLVGEKGLLAFLFQM